MHDDRVPIGGVDITTAAFALDPVVGYNSLRVASPISWQHASRGFLLTRFSDAAHALKSRRLLEPNFADAWHKIGRKLGKNFDASYRFFTYLPFTYEGERHKQLRATLARGVAPFADAEDVFNRCVERRLSAVRGDGGFDLVEQFSGALLFDVFCDLMAVPESERDEIKPLAHLSWALESTLPVRKRDEMTAIIARCMAPLTERVRTNLQRPGRSLLHSIHSALPKEEEDGVSATAHLAAVMLVMGNDALSGCISFAVRQLLSNGAGHASSSQSQWGGLSDDAIRYSATVDFLNRIVSSNFMVGACPFRGGERIVISPLAANHDPAMFGPDAGQIRYRPRVNVGLTFGAGAHVCVGARMSRNIVRSAFRGLAGLPGMQVMNMGNQASGKVIRTLKSLPIQFH